MSLTDKKCVPCEGGVLPLSGDALKKMKVQINEDWKFLGQDKIQRNFNFQDFMMAINFVNKIANVAESEDHHPDIHIFYNRVTIELWTHAIGGLSENDFILAAKIDDLYQLTDRLRKSA